MSDPWDPPGSSVHGSLQARILEWVAMPSFRGSSQPRDQTQVSPIASGFFTISATREVQLSTLKCLTFCFQRVYRIPKQLTRQHLIFVFTNLFTNYFRGKIPRKLSFHKNKFLNNFFSNAFNGEGDLKHLVSRP